MPRLLPTALATAVLVGAFAGVASARLDADVTPRAPLAPMVAPVALPLEDAAHPGTYGFRSAASIAAGMADASVGDDATAAGAASASITITATVLPVVTIVVDEDGDVVELVSNSPDRAARSVLFTVRDGSTSGDVVALDAATWADARDALASARAGAGTIWSA